MSVDNELLASLASEELLGVLEAISSILDIEFNFSNLKYMSQDKLLKVCVIKLNLLLEFLYKYRA